MDNLKHIVKIGNEEFSLSISSIRDGDQIMTNVDDLIKAQRALAMQLIKERFHSNQISPEYLNYFINVSGLKVRDISRYVGVEPALISQWRSNKNLSAAAWQLLRIFFLDFFEHGKVTHTIFTDNFHRHNKEAA